MGVPTLVIMRVLPSLEGSVGVEVVVCGLFRCLGALRDGTVV